MANYTQLTSTEVSAISERYNIKMISFESIKGGNSNSSYLLQGQEGQYVLTILEEKTYEKALKSAALLQWLQKHQFPTSQCRTTTTGEAITKHKGKPIIVKKWIEGSVIKCLNERQLKEAGKALGKLHHVPTPSFLSKANAYGIDAFESVLDKQIDVEYDVWLKRQLVLFNKTLPLNLPKGLIHADLFFDNVLFEKNDLKAIIDFEEACYYYLVFDVGMAIVGLCRTDESLDLKKIKAFLVGYQQIRSLSASEKAHLPFFIDYAATATSRWRFWKYNLDAPNPRLKNHHWKMVQNANEVKQLKKEDFLSAIFLRD